MKNPLVSPLDRNSTKQAKEMAAFYDETLGFTPNSLFTMMHRPRIAKAFLEMNQAVMVVDIISVTPVVNYVKIKTAVDGY